MPYK
jgi:hypothetical protein